MIDISVLVVSYNTRALTLACLRSVAAGCAGATHEIVLVDNASADGTVAAVAAEFPDVRVVALERNLGFAPAANHAAGVANGEHLVFLNPDTTVAPGALRALVAFAAAHPAFGVCGGRTVHPDGSPDPRSCWGAPTMWSTVCFALGLSRLLRRHPVFDPESLGRWERDSVRHVDVVSGCLLAVHRSVWAELGGFDPAFFMYGEDVDLCLRAASLGYRPAITPSAVVTHVVGAASPDPGGRRQLVLRGKATLLRTHWTPTAARLGVGLLLLGTGLRAMTARDRSWRDAWAHRAGWRDGYPRHDIERAMDPDPGLVRN